MSGELDALPYPEIGRASAACKIRQVIFGLFILRNSL